MRRFSRNSQATHSLAFSPIERRSSCAVGSRALLHPAFLLSAPCPDCWGDARQLGLLQRTGVDGAAAGWPSGISTDLSFPASMSWSPGSPTSTACTAVGGPQPQPSLLLKWAEEASPLEVPTG